MSKLDKNSVKKKKEESAKETPTTTDGNSALERLRKKKKEKKYRTSVYLKPEVFEKLITINGETWESFTEIIEMLLEDALKDEPIKPRYVEAYKKNLEKKQGNKKQNQEENEE